MTVAPLSKRIIAYIIDMLIFVAIIMIVGLFVKDNNNIATLNLELNSINELALNHEISITTYLNRFASIMQDMDLEKVLINILNCVFIMIYFVAIPYFFDGQTLGKRVMKIKVIRKDQELLMLNDLIVRNLIINGLGFLLISLCLLYITPSIVYLIITLLLGLLQVILVLITLFMVIYRQDKRGLHDVLGNTLVVLAQ